jgi:hypothetical protein
MRERVGEGGMKGMDREGDFWRRRMVGLWYCT